MDTDMKLIVGLGNPGKIYEHTRHNAGFLAIDDLAEKLEATWKADTKHRAEIAKVMLDGTSLLLAKPQTFMNLSGEAVQALVSYYKVAPDDLLIIQDELDLPPGRMAFLPKGGPAGHNGIISIQEQLGRTDILRLRIGIGRPTTPQVIEDWVLGKMDPETLESIHKTPNAIMDWVTQGSHAAMNTWNRS